MSAARGRRPLAVANWKMFHTTASAVAFSEDLCRDWPDGAEVELRIAPPNVYLAILARRFASRPDVALAGQNCHDAAEGAFTGEVSAPMLRDVGAQSVILGHSERRAMGESDELVGRKVVAAVAAGLGVILCLGESLEERAAGETAAVLRRQLRAVLTRPEVGLDDFVIAYEPVWAIGTGRQAHAEQVAEAVGVVRSELKQQRGGGPADSVRVLYGGSVNAANAAATVGQSGADGALIGGASVEVASFLAIAAAIRK